MARIFQLLSVALFLLAAYFLWQRNPDTAFVTGVLAVCTFFLTLRVGFRARSNEREAEKVRLRDEEAGDESTAEPH